VTLVTLVTEGRQAGQPDITALTTESRTLHKFGGVLGERINN
jgi:hypothetical protein